MKGDPSDTFSFVSFFPEAFSPFLSPFCDAVHSTFVQLRLCTPFSQNDIEAGTARSRTGGLRSSSDGGGGRRAEAERRRALALKALDQRLNAAAAAATDAPVSSTKLQTEGGTVEPSPAI